MVGDEVVTDARVRLIEVGASMAQDLGFGRIVGRILVYLYLAGGAPLARPCSLRGTRRR